MELYHTLAHRLKFRCTKHLLHYHSFLLQQFQDKHNLMSHNKSFCGLNILQPIQSHKFCKHPMLRNVIRAIEQHFQVLNLDVQYYSHAFTLYLNKFISLFISLLFIRTFCFSSSTNKEILIPYIKLSCRNAKSLKSIHTF